MIRWPDVGLANCACYGLPEPAGCDGCLPKLGIDCFPELGAEAAPILKSWLEASLECATQQTKVLQ